MSRLNVEASFRAAGYAAILLIGVLSLVPGTLRPETGAPGQYEHLAAYLGAAALLALGSGTATRRWQALWLVPYAAALEIAQHFVPGRHSRFSDFAVSSAGAVLGTYRRIRGCAYFVNDARRADRSDKRAGVRAARRPSLWDDLTAIG